MRQGLNPERVINGGGVTDPPPSINGPCESAQEFISVAELNRNGCARTLGV